MPDYWARTGEINDSFTYLLTPAQAPQDSKLILVAAEADGVDRKDSMREGVTLRVITLVNRAPLPVFGTSTDRVPFRRLILFLPTYRI